MSAVNLKGTVPDPIASVSTMQVHKVIGYGINDVQFEGGYCVDSRINADGYLSHPQDFSMDAFRVFLHTEIGGEQFQISGGTIDQCIHYSTRCGKNTLCLAIPEQLQKWYRKSDPIDEAESETSPFRTLLLDRGVPGYRGYMDSRTGRPVSSSSYILFKQKYAEYASPHRCEAEKYAAEYTLSEFACDMGFDKMPDAIDYVVPCVPTIINRLCAYLNLFALRSAVLALRPMVYTYWG